MKNSICAKAVILGILGDTGKRKERFTGENAMQLSDSHWVARPEESKGR